MFLVLNTTNRIITIQDLGVKIKSKLVIDLDKVCSRSIANSSYDLKKMMDNGTIKVLQKTKKHQKESQIKSNLVEEKTGNINKQIKSLKKELLEEIRKKQSINSQEVIEKLGNLTDILNNKEFKNVTINQQQPVIEKVVEIDEPVDLDTLTKIGEKAVNKMVDKSITNIKTKKMENKSKINVNDIVTDLEELL